MKTKYHTIFISDIHLGSKNCKADLLTNFLKYNECDNLYLVGDIIDGWKMRKRVQWTQEQNNVVRKILTKAKRNCNVYYICGNHDSFIRPWIADFSLDFGNIKFSNSAVYTDKNNKTYLVEHGDKFDGITSIAPWLCWLGDKAYEFLLSLNTYFNNIRHKLGFGYWSLSSYLKQQTKGALEFMFKFEHAIIAEAKRYNYDGVICGHIHKAEIKTIEGLTYMNCGDWQESCTALVETLDGEWKIINWQKINA